MCSTYNPLIRPFNLYPDNWFEGYPVKSTQIFFKKLGVILINQEKIRRAPWKNLGRFYRVPFKSLLRVQIKRAFVFGSRFGSWIPYACPYKPCIFFTPFFTAVYIVEWLIVQTIYVLNKKILQFLGLKSAVYNVRYICIKPLCSTVSKHVNSKRCMYGQTKSLVHY